MLRLLKSWEFAELRDAIGYAGYSAPTLDVIFPSWVNQQVENATHSLVGISRRDDFPAQISEDECRAFADWLVEHNQEALLWKYRACNRLIFGRDPGGRPGLGSEVQGLAVAVEGAIQAMCPKPGMSIKAVLPTIWDATTMAAYSKNHPLTQGVNADLEAALAKYDHLRSASFPERNAFYLLITVRIRNGSHLALSVDEITAETLVVYLLTAALITFHHVVWTKISAQPKPPAPAVVTAP